MSVQLSIAAAVIMGSLGLLAAAVRGGAWLATSVAGAMATLMLGLALLVGSLIPKGVVGAVTQFVFVAGAVWFLVLDWRLTRRRVAS